MNSRSKCLPGLVFPPSKELSQFRKHKVITLDKVYGIREVRQNSVAFYNIFWLPQYYVFVVLSGHVFWPILPALLLRLHHMRKKCIQNLPCIERPFGNYWASAMFSGPDFIANLSDGLKIIDPIFITFDDIGKLLFVTSLKH